MVYVQLLLGVLLHMLQLHTDKKTAEGWIDTVQKGKDIVSCLKYPEAYERVTALLELHPEVKLLSHRIVAELLGLQRETVTRVMNAEGIYKRKVA